MGDKLVGHQQKEKAIAAVVHGAHQIAEAINHVASAEEHVAQATQHQADAENRIADALERLTVVLGNPVKTLTLTLDPQ